MMKSTISKCGDMRENLEKANEILEKQGHSEKEISETVGRYMEAFKGVVEDHQLLGSYRLLKDAQAEVAK